MKIYRDNKTEISIIFTLITIVILLLSAVDNNIYLTWISILLLFLMIIYYVQNEKRRGIVFQGFLISFFVFILGKYLIQMLTGEMQSIFSMSIFFEESLYVYISLLAMFIGYNLFEKKTMKNGSYGEVIYQYIQSNRKMGDYAKKFFLICIVFSIAVNLDKALISFGNLYSITGGAKSRLPSVVQYIGLMSPMFFWAFLSTFPSKEKLKTPCYFFVFNALLTLFTGTRNGLVIDVLSLFMYILFRHNIRDDLKEDYWISRRVKVFIVVSLPIIVVFLGLFANIRLGEDAQYDGLLTGIIYFLDQQGGSVDVIGRGLYCKENFLLPTTNISYTFGPIINYFRNGFWGGMLGYSSLLTSSQDIELATYGNNLGATVTYLMADSYYFIGGGFGTCYIAELVVDFGYVGVIGYNLFLGWLFNNINYFVSEKWWKNAIGLLVVRNIMFMPRDFALGFVASLLSITNIIPLLILWGLKKYVR